MTDLTESTPAIQPGTVVLARKKTGVCTVAEIGVCYDVYELAGRPGYAFIFQNGGYDGFSPEDVAVFLMVTDTVCSTIADYDFRNVTQLSRDYARGRFDEAFRRPSQPGSEPR